MRKKFLIILLALCMCIGLLPVTAVAAPTDESEHWVSNTVNTTFVLSSDQSTVAQYVEDVYKRQALDTNQDLRDGMARLAEQFSQLTEEEYTNQALNLFRQAGLDLTGEELKMLLALRRETDRMLLQNSQKGKG